MIRVDVRTRERLRQAAKRESVRRGYHVSMVGLIREWVESYDAARR